MARVLRDATRSGLKASGRPRARLRYSATASSAAASAGSRGSHFARFQKALQQIASLMPVPSRKRTPS
jgi:hypothetical protein